MSVSVLGEFCIVVRKCSVQKVCRDERKFLRKIGYVDTFEEDLDFLSLGPLFGGEAMAEFEQRLGDVGLEFWEDYHCLAITHPDWLVLKATVAD
ncbi:MAG: hypothetical protein K0U74_14625 [Alphaproteobacteria bacterium]|nr:hypothetical protein [Alphaproteobacteria bacterium]